MIKNSTKARSLDVLGSIISLSCAVHCLVFPLFISLGSVFVLNEYVHELTEFSILVVSVGICLWSLIKSYKSHKRSLPFVLLALSIGMLVLARLFHTFSLEIVLNTSGALLIASAHLLNRRLLSSAFVEVELSRSDQLKAA